MLASAERALKRAENQLINYNKSQTAQQLMQFDKDFKTDINSSPFSNIIGENVLAFDKPQINLDTSGREK